MQKDNLIRLRSKVTSFVSKNPFGSFLSSFYLRAKNAAIWNRTSEIQKMISEYVNYGKIVSFNKEQSSKFIKNLNKKKALFIPHCLRNIENCRAKHTSEGLKCLGCGKCLISEMKKKATQEGYEVFIVPGLSMVQKIISKKKYDILIGVGCYNELLTSIKIHETKYKKPAVRLVPLLSDGCVNTDLDLNEFYRALTN